jgi:hypothetical protein
MTPVDFPGDTTTNGKVKLARAHVFWRGLILLNSLAVAVALAGGAYLFAELDDTGEALNETVETNSKTLCTIGSFLTGSPLIRGEGVGRRTFVGRLITTRKFLKDLQELDCPDDEIRGVTPEEIQRQIDEITEALKRGRRELFQQRRQREREAAGRGRTRIGSALEISGDDRPTGEPGERPPDEQRPPDQQPPSKPPPEDPPDEEPPPDEPEPPRKGTLGEVGTGLEQALDDADALLCQRPSPPPAVC